ncbi:uncharacterized protein I303_107506 [Kwoniella dejecticola CBS 10117]|uniref:Uncharacterized protein n=1 Tax=Kwoniella dejecticola CBS 10117 TaxID=1296121 RepID=A0A1A5ZZV7_9TREE|nr:uncharacterized protein I303_06911 [Kwoniella dejecticola CBS 10117]OBR83346.1 hypothetical protein I303_06911 [Kwoniella dejecticola CBS 10117]
MRSGGSHHHGHDCFAPAAGPGVPHGTLQRSFTAPTGPNPAYQPRPLSIPGASLDGQNGPPHKRARWAITTTQAYEAADTTTLCNEDNTNVEIGQAQQPVSSILENAPGCTPPGFPPTLTSIADSAFRDNANTPDIKPSIATIAPTPSQDPRKLLKQGRASEPGKQNTSSNVKEAGTPSEPAQSAAPLIQINVDSRSSKTSLSVTKGPPRESCHTL